jgi:hypothetical protein
MPNEKSNDEVDLMYLLSKTLYFFRRFGRIIFGSSLIGLCLSILFYWLSPKLYSSNLILQSTLYSNEEQSQIIKNWSALLNDNEHEILSQLLNCSPQLIKKLKSLSSDQIQKSASQTPNGFIVKVLITDNLILDSLQKSIVYGLENNNYIRERTIIRKANFIEMIHRVRTEIHKLDSTKALIENVINNKIRNTSPVIIDISSINTQLIQLNEKLLSYQEELKFVNPIHVLQNFTKFNRPKSPRLLKCILIGLFLGAFLGSMISLYLYLLNKLRSQPKLETV